MSAVEAHGLSRRLGGTVAVDGLDLSIPVDYSLGMTKRIGPGLGDLAASALGAAA